MQKIYFDNAATTPMDKDVITAIAQTMNDVYGNPSSTHQFGRKAKAIIEQARKNIANYFKVSSSEIIFTSGGSEADNLILNNAVKNLNVTRILTSKIEHHAVLHTIASLKKEVNIEVNYIRFNEKGEIDYEHLKELLNASDKKTLVSLMYVNNEIGNILNTKKVTELCRENNALFHSDTVQAIGHYTIDLQKTPIDFIAASAHKFHGSKGVGFAYIKKGFGILPILHGGAQEKGARAGTENVPNIVGMDVALNKMLHNLDAETKQITELKAYFISELKKNFKDIRFNGMSENLEKSSYCILNVRFNQDIPMLLFTLDLKGIAVSGGSACQSGSNTGSHVLNEIAPDKDTVNTSVRFSFSKYNTKKEVDYIIQTLLEIIKK